MSKTHEKTACEVLEEQERLKIAMFQAATRLLDLGITDSAKRARIVNMMVQSRLTFVLRDK